MRRRVVALTLLEVLFVTSLLGLFMYMVVRALMMGYRAHILTIEKTARYRDATVAVARMVRELSTANTVYTPDFGGSWTTNNPDNRLHLARNDATSALAAPPNGTEVEYVYDAPSKELRFTDPSRTPPYRVVAREVDGFTVEAKSLRIYDISIALKDNEIPITVTAQVIGY